VIELGNWVDGNGRGFEENRRQYLEVRYGEDKRRPPVIEPGEANET
jgi:hypothetical protein